MALIGKHLTLLTAADVTVFGGEIFQKFLLEVWLEENENEDKPYSTCLKPISTWCFQNPKSGFKILPT